MSSSAVLDDDVTHVASVPKADDRFRDAEAAARALLGRPDPGRLLAGGPFAAACA